MMAKKKGKKTTTKTTETETPVEEIATPEVTETDTDTAPEDIEIAPGVEMSGASTEHRDDVDGFQFEIAERERGDRVRPVIAKVVEPEGTTFEERRQATALALHQWYERKAAEGVKTVPVCVGSPAEWIPCHPTEHE